MKSSLKGLKAVVLGFGRSGQAAVRLLLVLGAEVTVSDKRPFEELPPAECYAFLEQGVQFETGGHRRETLLSADLVVVSPGVSPEIWQEAKEKGIPVIGELELAYRAMKRKDHVVAITGTNGKTTTTAMVSDILKLSGFRVFTGGNYGIPLSEYVLSGEPADRVVLEVSSFQLETIEAFRPSLGAVLNLTPDHLERYADLSHYARAKLRLFENMEAVDRAILPHPGLSGAGGEILLRELSETQAKICFFGEASSLAPSSGLRDERKTLSDGPGLSVEVREREFVLRISEEEEVYSFAGFRLLGRHNRLNFAVASFLARLSGATPEAVKKAVTGFVGFPHRLEYVGCFGGVYFVNDSKATNVDATIKALEGLSPPIVLIAGGLHKGASYRPLYELIRQKVRVLILMGASRFLMAETLSGATETLLSEGLPEALALALKVARPGDTVLLSPAAASFDQFESYEERGEVFRDLVLTYAPKVLSSAKQPEVLH